MCFWSVLSTGVLLHLLAFFLNYLIVVKKVSLESWKEYSEKEVNHVDYLGLSLKKEKKMNLEICRLF